MTTSKDPVESVTNPEQHSLVRSITLHCYRLYTRYGGKEISTLG
jgi:hypothetical protein